MKKYLFIVLCACVAMYVAADDSLRSQEQFAKSVADNHGTVVGSSQDDKQEGIGETYMDATQNNILKGIEKYITPVIKGGGLVPRPRVRPDRPGNTGGKSSDGLTAANMISESGIGTLPSETAEESNAPILAMPSELVFAGDYAFFPLGGGLVPRPPRNPGSNSNIVAYVSSRDEHSVLPPFIVLQDGILYTNSTGIMMLQKGDILEPFGGGLVPRPPRNGGIIVGASGLSRNNSNGSGSRRSHAAPVMMGDVDHDGKVDVLDITALNGYLLGNSPEAFVIEAADVNGDNNIDVDDVTALTNYVLNGTWSATE